jgi:bisphosphoglycerate-independent phosphoglycerate mutase (AlkP superfamily)
MAAIPQETLIAIVSDHGNIEDIRAGHTVNPALGLFIGAGHEAFARQELSLTDVAPMLLSVLAQPQ